MKIFCKELNKEFNTKEEMFLELKANMKNIFAKKMETIKYFDPIGVSSSNKVDTKILNSLKALNTVSFNPLQKKSLDYTKMLDLPNLKVKATSSCTNWFDSHMDVHIDGNYDKTIQDKGANGFPHIQEHEMREFEYIIADESLVKTYTENTTFKKLGFDYNNKTQALKFESIVDPNRNIFMYNQYANGWVKNHSIGMSYINGKLVFCANSEIQGMEEDKANYDKYYPLIANKEDVDQYGYFWAVLEIKLYEHSAVPYGSNKITPTDSVEIEAEKSLDNNQADETLQQAKRKLSII